MLWLPAPGPNHLPSVLLGGRLDWNTFQLQETFMQPKAQPGQPLVCTY